MSWEPWLKTKLVEENDEGATDNTTVECSEHGVGLRGETTGRTQLRIDGIGERSRIESHGTTMRGGGTGV